MSRLTLGDSSDLWDGLSNDRIVKKEKKNLQIEKKSANKKKKVLMNNMEK